MIYKQHTENEGVTLDQLLGTVPGSSFLLSAPQTIEQAGIKQGDLVILDTRRDPQSGDIVAIGEYENWELMYFQPEHKTENQFGVVVSVIRKYY